MGLLVRRAIRHYGKYVSACSLVCIWVVFYIWHSRSNMNDGEVACGVSSNTRIKLFELLSTTQRILQALDINHFLCYDSLYGALEDHEPFPWQSEAHLCLLRDDFNKLDEASFHRRFQLEDLFMKYNTAEGRYSVVAANKGRDSKPIVFLHVFEVDEKHDTILRHSGWRRKLPTTNCEANSRLHCFPRQLSVPPLQMKSFGPLLLPIPKEPKKMLKYQFPNSWWKPLKPIC